MAGVRLNGVLEVDGELIPISISSPLGSQAVADSVSVTPAANASVSAILDALNEEVTIDVPAGFNSVTAIITPTAPVMTLVGLQGSAASGAFTSLLQAYDFINGIWTASVALTAGVSRRVLSFPVVSGKPFSLIVAAYTSGSVNVELVASRSLALGTPLTNIELRASQVNVNTELPTAAALADNTVNPTVPGVGAYGMVFDGATWDRQPGTAADGTLVNLGANNDVTVTSGSVTASINPLANLVSTKTGLTGQAPAFVLVGLISALAVAAAPLRKGLILTNTSPNIISLSFAPFAAVVGSGITLAAGASFKMDEYSLCVAQINAISNVGGSNLSIQEFL